jgi:hypothetical protein
VLTHHNKVDGTDRDSFASKVRNFDVSFTPGLSPVMHGDIRQKNRFNGLLFGAKMKPFNISKLRQL